MKKLNSSTVLLSVTLWLWLLLSGDAARLFTTPSAETPTARHETQEGSMRSAPTPGAGNTANLLACVEPGNINPGFNCPTVFDPVCGCDGQTYTNDCVAANQNGLTGYLSGVCADILDAYAEPLPCNTPATPPFFGNTTINSLNLLSTYSCNPNWLMTGPEDIYSFSTISGGNFYCYVGTPNIPRLDIFLVRAGADGSLECIDYADQVISTNIAPGAYYLIVDGRDGASGSYNLQTQCPSGGNPSSCPTNPDEVMCLTWVQGLLQNQTANACELPNYDKVETGSLNNTPVVIFHLDDGLGGSGTDIYDCQGNLIQSCFAGFGGSSCQPLFSGNLYFQVSGLSPVWECNQPLPDCGGPAGDCACIAYTGDICDNFDSYTAGQDLGPQSPCWTTWTGIVGDDNDGLVSTTQASSGNNALRIQPGDDVVLQLGNRSSGHYLLSYNLYIPDGRAAYQNLLHVFTPNGSGNQWACELFFYTGGSFELNAGGNNAASGTYQQNFWTSILYDIDIDGNQATLYVNGQEVHSWPFDYRANSPNGGIGQLAALNFYGDNALYDFYVDDVRVVDLNNLPNCQGDPLSYPWIQDIVNNPDCPDCSGLLQAEWQGSTIFIHYWDAATCGIFDAGGHRVYDCEGNLLQVCSTTIAGNNCTPNAGVFNWSNEQLIWECPGQPGGGCGTPDEILCLAWLQDLITIESNTFCNMVCPGGAGMVVSLVNIDGEDLINISTNCASTIWNFYTCDGQLVDECIFFSISGGGNCSQPVIDAVNSGIELWTCSQPLPSCTTDGDGDGIADTDDNCPYTPNPGQEDGDGDGVGDACELPDCPTSPEEILCLNWVQDLLSSNNTSSLSYVDLNGTIYYALQTTPTELMLYDCEGNLIENCYDIQEPVQNPPCEYNCFDNDLFFDCSLLVPVYSPNDPLPDCQFPCVFETQITKPATTFGGKVAINDDYSLVGAPGEVSYTGAAYVYKKINANWLEKQRLIASDGVSGDWFGGSVSIANNYSVIGAYEKNGNEGAVYVFENNGDSWVQQTILTASDGESGDRFGLSVSIDGDYIAVGTDNNAAYVFKRSGNNWLEQAIITASDGAPSGCFGCSIYITEDYLICGSPGNYPSEGSAYVFRRTGDSWSEETKLIASDGTNYNNFGTSVAKEGNYIAIGAPNHWFNNAQGSVYIFQKIGNSWIEIQKLLASPEAPFSVGMGMSIDMDNGKLVAGGYFGEGITSGTINVFEFNGNSYEFKEKLYNDLFYDEGDNEFNGFYGHSTGISGNQVIVGASRLDDPGSTFIYNLDCNNYSCPVDPDDILCLDWIQDTINYYHPNDPSFCDPANPIESGYGVSLASHNENTLIVLSEVSIDLVNSRYFSCDGTFIGTSTVGLVTNTFNPPYLENYSIDITVWDCPQPLPSCTTDTDSDGIADANDNCPYAPNPGQEDGDGDGVGDACELPGCPAAPDEILCMEWLQDEIELQDPGYPDCGQVSHQENYTVSRLENAGGDVILCISDIINIDAVSNRYYDCSGRLLGTSIITFIPDYDPPYLEDFLTDFTVWEEIWDCTQPLPGCSDSPWPISCNNNGNIQLVHIQYDYFSSDMGDGAPLEEGDWVGIFFQAEDGSLICTDAQPFPPASEGGFFLSACGESAAGADDGFEAGEQIRVKVFKNGVEYTPNQLIVDFHSQFSINPVFPDAEHTFQGNFANSAIQRIERLRIIEPDCDDPITISCPVVLTGQSNSNGISEAISYNCFSNLVNGPEMIYSFHNPATQDVRICMDNLQDDLELLLMDECDKDHCIAKSERTGINPEVIVYQELPPGDYFIFVEGYLGYESTFDLSLECGQFNPGRLSCPATTIQCDGVITGHTSTGCAEASAYPCSEGYYPGKEKLYRFKSDAGGYATIRLQPESQDLDLFLLEQGNRELCITSSTESGLEMEQIEVSILADKYYYILVDEYKTENTSSFTLSLSCHEGGGPPTPPCFTSTLCDNAEEIFCDTPTTGHTNTGIDCIEKWGNCPSFNTGPEVIYRFNNTEELQDVIINLDGFSENLNLYILDACSPIACREGWSSNKSGLIPEGVVIPAMPPGEYYIVVDTYSSGASSAFNLEIQCNSTVLDCFEVEVPEGVSYISSNVVPNDPSMFYLVDDNFKDVIDVISNDQMQNYAPGYTDPNDPSLSIIKEWNTVDGYRVVSSNATTLNFCGEKSDPDLLKDVIAFETNGTTPFSNYIFYPFDDPEYAEQVFEQTAIENINQVQYIYPNNSSLPKNYFFFCGAINPNGDSDFLMEAGKGYILKVCTDGSFSYRSPEEKYFENGCAFFRMPIHPLENSSWIKISSELLGPLLLPGDEIAFFNEDGQIVGSYLFTGFNAIVTISGDMAQTEAVEGMIQGKPFNAKIWRSTSGSVETLNFTFKTHENAFLPHTVYEISDLRISEANVETMPTLKCSVFPNPARHMLSLSIFLPRQDKAQASLFDLKGRRHQFYEWPSLNGGTHQLDLNLGHLPSGVYYLKVRAESGVFTEKIILAP